MEDRPPDAPVPPTPPAPYTPPAGFAPPPPPPPPPGGFTPPPPPTPPGTPPPARPPIPWEDPARPKLAAFFETVKLLYTRTREAFERVPLTSDVLQPYLFAIIAGWIGMAVSAVWQMMSTGLMHAVMPASDEGSYAFLRHFLAGPMTIVLAPVIVAVSVLVCALIMHLFLMILGAAKSGFAATLRVACYAQAATLLGIIPICGSIAQPFALLAFLIIGFSAAHRVSTGRAAVAVLLPAVLCCLCASIVFLITGATAFNMMKQNMGRF